MKIYLFLSCILIITSCKTTKPDVKRAEKNGALILSMQRTPCYGRCPVYDIKLYRNGLLIYNTKQFADTVACRYLILSKQEIEEVKSRFDNSNFFSLADQYPEDRKAPTDIPSCILYYSNGAQQKTITDKRLQTPEALTTLEKSVDALLNFKKLQFCDN